MRALTLIALTPFALALFPFGDPVVDKHVEALQKAQSFEATFTVTQVGGSTDEQTLSLSKPNKLRWESPSTIVVGDGTTLWSYDKAKKVYTKSVSSEEAIQKALSPEAVIAWSAFFNPKFGDLVRSTAKGNARKARGTDVVDYTVTLKDDRVLTIPFNASSGIAWGAKFMAKGAASDTIALVKELKVGEAGLADTLFAWTPPADATDAAAGPKTDPDAPKYADVKPIFDANCVGCHSGTRPKGRFDMSSYESIMSGRNVVAGNADSSRMFKEIKSGKMPPAGPLAHDAMDKIAAWINGGAQK